MLIDRFSFENGGGGKYSTTTKKSQKKMNTRDKSDVNNYKKSIIYVSSKDRYSN